MFLQIYHGQFLNLYKLEGVQSASGDDYICSVIGIYSEQGIIIVYNWPYQTS
jgi:hypothetical protein